MTVQRVDPALLFYTQHYSDILIPLSFRTNESGFLQLRVPLIIPDYPSCTGELSTIDVDVRNRKTSVINPIADTTYPIISGDKSSVCADCKAPKRITARESHIVFDCKGVFICILD